MPRTSLSQLQSIVADAISADPWFAGVPIVTDTGSRRNDVETANAETGFVVIVDPIETVTRADGGRGSVLARAQFGVEVWENPTVNPSKLAKNQLEAVAKIAAIVNAIDQGPGDIHPESESNLAELFTFDSGLRCYLLNFSKLVQLS